MVQRAEDTLIGRDIRMRREMIGLGEVGDDGNEWRVQGVRGGRRMLWLVAMS